MPQILTLSQSNINLSSCFSFKQIYVMIDISKLTLDGYPYYKQEAHNFLSQFYDDSKTVANITCNLVFDISTENQVIAHMVIDHYLLVDETYLLTEEEQKQNKRKASLKASQKEVLEEAKSNSEFAKHLYDQLECIVHS